MSTIESRRSFLLAAAGGTLASLSLPAIAFAGQKGASPKKGSTEELEVTATEDLMREHGVIRRALLVYSETSRRMSASGQKIDAAQLQTTAKLFRAFGEDYHERQLEEAHIFPVMRKKGGVLAHYADVLTAQHARGREITDYILSVTKAGSVDVAHGKPLAAAMDGLVRMYQHHAAREDTIIFPAWKNTMNKHQFEEISDLFEDIEHKTFGADGFEQAERTIGQVESALGLADVAQFTPAPPPKP